MAAAVGQGGRQEEEEGGVSIGKWAATALSVELLGIGIAYAFQRDWPHCGYYVSAAVLNGFVVSMS